MKKIYTIIALGTIVYNASGMDFGKKSPYGINLNHTTAQLTVTHVPPHQLQVQRVQQNAELAVTSAIIYRHSSSSLNPYAAEMHQGKVVDLVAYEKWLRDTNHGDSAITEALQTMRWHNNSVINK
jgi:hypothetical protein